MNDYLSGTVANFGKVNNNGQEPISIESGYFIFTLMPSLRCSLNCPHCYLSKEQRRSSEIMLPENIEIACKKINQYYQTKNIAEKVIVNYWYGGEPTEMGLDYFTDVLSRMEKYFKIEDGYHTKHTILTSLITVDPKVWFPFFHQHGGHHFQSSFDGLMRGKIYVKKWEEKIKLAVKDNLSVGTISVVNHEMLKIGAKETLHYLTNLGIVESSFLPFMWNEQNDGAAYGQYAPSMNAWSDFMIKLTEEWVIMKNAGQNPPMIGQMAFVLSQQQRSGLANIAGQTLFLLPNGDFVLPDYKKGFQEYMRKFGNILEQDFASILNGSERRSYLRKQVLKNGNSECQGCDFASSCVMEFWKKNRENDDCFGGSRYVRWLQDNAHRLGIKITHNKLY